jgi:hypothetical protein
MNNTVELHVSIHVMHLNPIHGLDLNPIHGFNGHVMAMHDM